MGVRRLRSRFAIIEIGERAINSEPGCWHGGDGEPPGLARERTREYERSCIQRRFSVAMKGSRLGQESTRRAAVLGLWTEGGTVVTVLDALSGLGISQIPLWAR